MDNVMKVQFSALEENESFSRALVAAFIMPLDPTIEEITEIKTAVSEAVSNCVIHGYMEHENKTEAIIEMECTLNEKGKVTIRVTDHGAGIDNISQAMEPLYTTGNSDERSGMGFTVMESFMDKLIVESEKGVGTTVTMTKYLDTVVDR